MPEINKTLSTIKTLCYEAVAFGLSFYWVRLALSLPPTHWRAYLWLKKCS